MSGIISLPVSKKKMEEGISNDLWNDIFSDMFVFFVLFFWRMGS